MGSQWAEEEEEEGGVSSWEICDAWGKGQLAGQHRVTNNNTRFVLLV